ncbi:MAG: helix-turn-helix transcriptional regulator [Bacteroidaceae bacterium]|nr:helix-turn-helix transcriptional regulator [Bacteroidaceae bacterium]
MIPRIAIIDQNTLEATGLKNIICDMVPMADVSTFASVEALVQEEDSSDETARFFHFFVSSQVLISHADFFLARQRQTIVLTTQPIAGRQFEHFRTLNTSQLEHDLLKSILTMFQHAHGQHPLNSPQREEDNIVPVIPRGGRESDLSSRETEVLALVVKGCINKEIADRLCISLPTVITHRKNICDKLHLRSVSSLTIYAVTHGIVSAEDI